MALSKEKYNHIDEFPAGTVLIEKTKFDLGKGASKSISGALSYTLKKSSKNWTFNDKHSGKLVENIKQLLKNEEFTDSGAQQFFEFGANFFETLSGGAFLMNEKNKKKKSHVKISSSSSFSKKKKHSRKDDNNDGDDDKEEKTKSHKQKRKSSKSKSSAKYKYYDDHLRCCLCGLYLPRKGCDDEEDETDRDTSRAVHYRTCPICSYLTRCLIMSIVSNIFLGYAMYILPSGSLSTDSQGRSIKSILVQPKHDGSSSDIEDNDTNLNTSNDDEWDTETGDLKKMTKEEAEKRIQQDEIKHISLAAKITTKTKGENGKIKKRVEPTIRCYCCGSSHKAKPGNCPKHKEILYEAFVKVAKEITKTSLVHCLHNHHPRVLRIVEECISSKVAYFNYSWTFETLSNKDNLDSSLLMRCRTKIFDSNDEDDESDYLWDQSNPKEATCFQLEDLETGKCGSQIDNDQILPIVHTDLSTKERAERIDDTELRLILALMIADETDKIIEEASKKQDKKYVSESSFGKKRRYNFDYWIESRYIYVLLLKIRLHHNWKNALRRDDSTSKSKTTIRQLVAKSANSNSPKVSGQKRSKPETEIPTPIPKRAKTTGNDTTNSKKSNSTIKIGSKKSSVNNKKRDEKNDDETKMEIDYVLKSVGSNIELADEENPKYKDNNDESESQSSEENMDLEPTVDDKDDEVSDKETKDKEEEEEDEEEKEEVKEKNQSTKSNSSTNETGINKLRSSLNSGFQSDFEKFELVQHRWYTLLKFTTTSKVLPWRSRLDGTENIYPQVFDIKCIDLFWRFNHLISKLSNSYCQFIQNAVLDRGEQGDLTDIKIQYFKPESKNKGSTQLMSMTYQQAGRLICAVTACDIPSIIINNSERMPNLFGVILNTLKKIPEAKADYLPLEAVIDAMYKTLDLLFSKKTNFISTRLADYLGDNLWLLSSLFEKEANGVMDNEILDNYLDSLRNYFQGCALKIGSNSNSSINEKFDCIWNMIERKWFFFPHPKDLQRIIDSMSKITERETDEKPGMEHTKSNGSPNIIPTISSSQEIRDDEAASILESIHHG